MWTHKKTISGGEKFYIDDINILDNHEWIYINDFCDCFSPCKCGTRTIVKDPNYNAPFNLDIIQINANDKQIIFGLVEFYNNIFGIYLDE
jgi:hypothetical protein